jgi:hypothetical protein
VSDLLNLARRFDVCSDIDERVRIAEQMRPLLGERYNDYDKRFTTLVESHPDLRWPAERTLRAMGIHKDGCTAMYQAWTMLGCGCWWRSGVLALPCDTHALRAALHAEG